MVSTTSSLPQSSSSPVDLSIDGTDGMSNLSAEETSIILQLKKMLRNTNAELDRIKDKCQELRDNNQKLELQNVQAVHQITKLQDFEQNNQFLLSRVKELEASGPSLDSVLETASMNGRRQNGSHRQQSSYDSASQIQQNEELKQEVASITSERDALAHKIRAWELGKKPYAQQQQQELRSVHYIDLENERNRLLEELSQKTVFTEEVLTKNENLTVRSKEYEKRVWELEEQVCKLEAERSTLPRSRAELIELEARAEAADAMAEKLQDLEGQATLVKNFQERINELETTNAELEHSNWKLTENLNVVNHQHTLLSKEFESFRSKDKDDRRLEYLATRNRELETILADQPNFKEEYERVSLEMDKLKVKLPQLEGQAKQVTLLRARVLQLEKQIKTMEDLHPRLGEMQQLHERNLFLEEELGELEHLRARELELEQELQESKARLIQLETNKTRMNSFSGLKQQTRARSGSVAQHGPPLPFGLLQQQQQQHQAQHAPIAENESLGAAADLVNKIGGNVPLSHLARSSLVAGGSMDSIQAPRREFPPAVVNGGSSGGPSWPSGRSSVSMSNASHRISTSSSTSTVLSSSSGTSQQRMSNQGYSAPASPEVTSDEEDKREIEALKRAAAMKEEPGSLVHSGSVPATVA
ncbi:hypothetical protein B0O80DRAFT_216885 [Mortierella sp. GBAus27b]|nr:hypothetical protein B0O80DRAFT_216885 [Mortierella sp. GBAus27b]